MKSTISQTWQRLGRGAFELLFPSACVICDAELTADEAPFAEVPLCRECVDRIEMLAGPTCVRCGAPVPNFGQVAEEVESDADPSRKSEGCYRCWGRKIWFDETVALGHYGGLLREILLRMKQAAGDDLSLALGELIWTVRGERLQQLDADVVVPIPLHWRRRLVHQTNSASLLAEVISRRLQIPQAGGLLRRRRHTRRQTELTPPQKWKNVRQAFAVRSGFHLNEAHVLVVDDILTTGATCSEAARALRNAGAAHVTVVVAARAIG